MNKGRHCQYFEAVQEALKCILLRTEFWPNFETKGIQTQFCKLQIFSGVAHVKNAGRVNSASIFHMRHSTKDLQLTKLCLYTLSLKVWPKLCPQQNTLKSLLDSFKILAMPSFIHQGFPECHSTGVLSRFNHKSLMFCLPYLSSINLYLYAC